MAGQRDGVVRAISKVGWVGGLALALALGATADGVNAQQLGALVLAAYLGGWGLVFLASQHGAIGNAARFVACTGSIVLAIGVLDALGVLGLVNYPQVFQIPADVWARPGNRPDSDLLYVRAGNQYFQRTLTGNDVGALAGGRSSQIYQCDIHYDSRGFRNPTDLESADVIVVGDSFIEGTTTPQADLLTARLAAMLGRTVANLGRNGDGPQQELEVLKRYGLTLHPRVCVWAFYEGNDLRDARNYDSDRDAVRGRANREWWLAMAQRSFTRNALQCVIQSWLHPTQRLPAALYTGRFTDCSGGSVEMSFGSTDHHDKSAPGGAREHLPEVSRVCAVLAEAQRLCRDQGIELVVVFVPTKFRVYRDYCTFDAASPCRSWPADALPRVLGEMVEQLSPEIRYLDLTPRLQADAARGSLVYLPDDSHWTSEGHRVAALATGECLQSVPALRRRMANGETRPVRR